MQDDDTVYERGARATMTVDQLAQQVETLEKLTAAQLQSINKTSLQRAARHRAALFAESYPAAGKTLLERVGAAIRGEA